VKQWQPPRGRRRKPCELEGNIRQRLRHVLAVAEKQVKRKHGTKREKTLNYRVRSITLYKRRFAFLHALLVSTAHHLPVSLATMTACFMSAATASGKNAGLLAAAAAAAMTLLSSSLLLLLSSKRFLSWSARLGPPGEPPGKPFLEVGDIWFCGGATIIGFWSLGGGGGVTRLA
jgi:hypothetical protein